VFGLHSIRKQGSAGGIILLHGFEGLEETWGASPDMLALQPVLSDWDIHALSLPIPFLPDHRGHWRLGTPLAALATTLASLLQAPELKPYRRIAFLAHSLGGILLQRVLLDSQTVREKTSHVILYATPNWGGKGTGFLGKQADDLVPGSPFIFKLRLDWDETFPSGCAFTVVAVAGRDDAQVSIASATEPFSNSFQVVRGDHLGIVQPTVKEKQGFDVALGVLCQGAQPAVGGTPLLIALEHQRLRDEIADLRDRVLDDTLAVKMSLDLESLGRQKEALDVLERQLPFRTGSNILGTLGGRYKRLWLQDRDLRPHAERACELYDQGCREARDRRDYDQLHYHGINLAFMELVYRKNVDAGVVLAEQVVEAVKHCKGSGLDDEMWAIASHAEACLHLLEFDRAVFFYRSLLLDYPLRLQHVRSMRQQALLVAETCINFAQQGDTLTHWVSILEGTFGAARPSGEASDTSLE